MIHLTYTILFVQVGAERYWEEEKEFLSSDKNSLFIIDIIEPAFDKHEIALNKSLDKNRMEVSGHFYKQNHSHPLSELANKLGAKIYGGFEDEKDFHLLLPTVAGFKIGDCIWFDGGPVCVSALNIFTMVNSLPESENLGTGINPVYVDQLFTIVAHEQKELNIFHEYARTGVIENDLYKQFFK